MSEFQKGRLYGIAETMEEQNKKKQDFRGEIMNNSVEIQGKQLEVKEYRGKRVVTFKDIDAVHQRAEGTAHRNFKANKTRFISGVDFFTISAKDVGTNFVQTYGFNIKAPSGILITESGYLMLVKSFTDDLAWKVQRELVDSYFRVKEIVQEQSNEQPETNAKVIDTDKLIKCAEIMAGCLEGNRPYVLNILHHMISDIGDVYGNQKAEEAPDTSVKTIVKPLENTSKEMRAGYSKPFNNKKFDQFLSDNYISSKELEGMINCSSGCVSKWRSGKVSPGTHYRILICESLEVPEGYFDKLVRNKR